MSAFGNIGDMSYGELLSALRKDLQLDAQTDILARTILAALVAHHDIAYGVAVVTWPGATSASNTISTPHGLGRVPAVALAGAAIGAPSFCHAMTSADATNINIRLHTTDASSPANPSNTSVGWIALG